MRRRYSCSGTRFVRLMRTPVILYLRSSRMGALLQGAQGAEGPGARRTTPQIKHPQTEPRPSWHGVERCDPCTTPCTNKQPTSRTSARGLHRIALRASTPTNGICRCIVRVYTFT